MKKFFLVVGLAILAAGAYYFLAPLLNTVEVQDELPDSFTQPIEAGGEVYAMDGPFPVAGTIGHPAEGELFVYEGDGKRFIRFENFKTINGPQLHLYLATDKDATEYIDLGPIRGTEGNINYELPDDIVLEDYPFVLHWCVPFSVLFNYADTST